MKNSMTKIASILALSFAISSPLLAEDDRASIMVFDASGSMWGQLKDGRTKIDVAKKVIGGYLKDRDQNTPLGIIAYGHNRKGDCSDIEVLAPVGKQDSSALATHINKIKPKGKTPLTDALELAVKQIPKTSEEADIILITDGLETCDRDPCALAQKIADEGITIRAHVVGFGLSEKEVNSLSCITEKTGGHLLRPQTGKELSDALNKVESTPAEPTKPSPLPIKISLKYEAGSARPTSVRYSAKNSETNKVIELAKTNDIVEIVNGFNTELLEGKWLLMAEGPQGVGELEITAKSGEWYRIPYTAQKADFSLKNYGPYQLGSDQSFLLKLGTPMQSNLTLSAMLFPADSVDDKDRIEHEYLIGVGKGIREINFKSPKSAGKYKIVIGRSLKDQVASFDIEFAEETKPSIKIPASVKPNEKFSYELYSHWYRNNYLLITQNGKEISDTLIQYTIEDEGVFLTAPNKEGHYTLSLQHTDNTGKWVSTELTTLIVEDNPATGSSTPTEPEKSSSKVEASDDEPLGGQGLSADEHGWEPISENSTVNKALLLSPKSEAFVSLCHDKQCTYDDKKTGFKGIKLLGDYGLLEPLKHDDGRPWLTIINEINGEWLQVNPPQETDMTMSCVRVGTKGYHEQNPNTATDSICTVKGANGYTVQMLEVIETWVVERNIALKKGQEENKAESDDTNDTSNTSDTPFGTVMSESDIAELLEKVRGDK